MLVFNKSNNNCNSERKSYLNRHLSHKDCSKDIVGQCQEDPLLQQREKENTRKSEMHASRIDN